MRIPCPYCGPRELGEFTYRGDASLTRPASTPAVAVASGELSDFHEYVYLRENKAGPIREHWYHGVGCRAWLVVERNTLTHEILSVEPALAPEAA